MASSKPFTGNSYALAGGDGKEDKKNSSGPSNGPNIEEKNAPITANEEAMQIKIEDEKPAVEGEKGASITANEVQGIVALGGR